MATGQQTIKLEGFKNGGIGATFNHASDLLASAGWASPITGQLTGKKPLKP